MKILIADDHAIVREGIKQIIRTINEVTLVDEASDDNECFCKILRTEYDLIILDISMPKLSGLDILQKMKDKKINSKVLVLSLHPQEQYAIRTFKLGASGYISKDSAFDELLAAITKIAAGGKYVSAALAEKMLFTSGAKKDKIIHEQLSDREFQVMILLAKGHHVKEIATELFISDKTVSTYRSRILEKMNLKNNAEITLYAIKNNLIQ